MLNVGLGGQRRARRGEIGALPFQIDVSSEGSEVIIGCEMPQIQFVGLQIGFVGGIVRVEFRRSRERSVALASRELGGILLSIGLQIAFQCDVFRDVHIFANIFRQKSFRKFDIRGCRVEIDIGFQTVDVVEVFHRTRRFHAKRSRLRYIQVAEIHILQISAHRSVDFQRFVGPFLQKIRRHIFQKRLQILFPERCLEGRFHRSVAADALDILWTERIQCHIDLARNRRRRRFNLRIPQSQAIVGQ